ncbi:hypothetical protein Vadar_012400 [Vaccinium darrowii]|uniref:Uncharacterized protein n=1 Tax=Vaccinium darrowii TaxID=229202 RepID=A0ACB7XYN4_9ERIC|nr:hypothetical protein Vadar_012400 [Vaccinium darrowii]
MVRKLGYEFEAINFCIKVGGGGFSKIKSDADALGLTKFVNGDRVVKVYSLIEIDNYFATQFSQYLDSIPTPNVTSISPGSKGTTNSTPKTKRATTKSPRSKRTIASTKKTTNKRSIEPVVTTSSPPISGTTSVPPSKGSPPISGTTSMPSMYSKQRILKDFNKFKGHVEVEISGDTSDEYDPESSSDSSDEEVFYDSEYDLTDDDKLFEKNIDRDEDSCALGGPTHIADYESIVEELRAVDGYCGSSSDELDSLCTSSDEDGLKPKKKHKVFNDQTDTENPVFMVGMEFKSHSQFRDAVKEYSIKHGKKIKFLKSDREKVRAVCKKGCPWECYASYVSADQLYRIKTHTSQHKCIRSYDVSWVSGNWIVNKYCNKIRYNLIWLVPSLHTTIQQEWTCKVDIQKVYSAKRKALNIIHGSAIEQFAQLWGYAKEIRQCNPVVEKEKYKTWYWFLELLGQDLNIQNTGAYSFMSDKQKGLIETVRTLYPNAEHRFCVRHLYNNFKQNFKGLVLKDILWKAARATNVQSFNRAMQEMKQIDANAYNWLSDRPPVHWSRSHFSSYSKCDILLNNLSESFNSCILGARDQPIVGMLESIRLILMETIKKKRTAMMRYTGVVCLKVVKAIEKLIGSEYAKGWVPS